jgi:imidazolonepropionase-like amidohydrolase
MKGVALVAAVVIVAQHSGALNAQTEAVVAFVNVNVVSMEREQVDPGRTVVVRGHRIVAIDASSPPAGSLVIDGNGGFLAPGLTDSHVHLTTDMPWAPARADFGDAVLYLAHGVTTVVNLRGTPTQLDWKRRVEAGELPGPTIYTSGEFLNEPRVSTPEDVQREVEAQTRDGYDVIKFHEIFDPATPFLGQPRLSRASYLQIFETARRANIRVVGHAPVNLDIGALLAASGGAVAHVGELVRLYFRPPVWVFLGYAASTLVLLTIAGGWGAAALWRRLRGRPVNPDRLIRVRLLMSSVLAGSVAAFVVGALAGLGGQFFDSGAWRLGFVVVSGALVVVALLTVVAGVRVLRDGAVPIGSRGVVVLATLACLVVAYTSAVHYIPGVWKTGESGRSRLATRIRDAHISVQTTLGIYDVGVGATESAARVVNDPAFSALLPQTQALWRGVASRPRPGALMSLVEMPPRYADFTRAITGSLHRSGVQLLAGTDAMGAPLLLPGRSLLLELALLVDSGLTPFDAIRTATVNPSQFLGRNEEFGTIAVGKRADLLLLERNPLEDVAAFNHPLGVMVRGRWLPREKLQSLLSALR